MRFDAAYKERRARVTMRVARGDMLSSVRREFYRRYINILTDYARAATVNVNIFATIRCHFSMPSSRRLPC